MDPSQAMDVLRALAMADMAKTIHGNAMSLDDELTDIDRRGKERNRATATSGAGHGLDDLRALANITHWNAKSDRDEKQAAEDLFRRNQAVRSQNFGGFLDATNLAPRSDIRTVQVGGEGVDRLRALMGQMYGVR